MNDVLRLLCQVFISIILIKSIYCLMVPKAIRKVISKIGSSLCNLACNGLNRVNDSIPTVSQVEEDKPNLRIIK